MVIETMAERISPEWTLVAERNDNLVVYREDSVHVSGEATHIYHLALGDKVIGRIDIYPRSARAYITGSFIKPPHRGRGFGRFFYVAIINDQIQMGRNVLSDMNLSTRARHVWESLEVENPSVVKRVTVDYGRTRPASQYMAYGQVRVRTHRRQRR